MVMPLAGTFQYFAILPGKVEEHSQPWPVRLREPVKPSGDELRDSRLVGLSPHLQITDGGPTPDPGRSRPAVLRSRFTLTASEKRSATVSAASFYVDRDLARAFEPGDVLHMARTGSAGLAVSLLRHDQLVFAAGAISSLPLGNVEGRIPSDLLSEAKLVFMDRDPAFEFLELPIQIGVSGKFRIMFGGYGRLRDYEIWVKHGFYVGIPGQDECVAISLRGACGAVPARSSAQLLDDGALEIIPWEGHGS